MFTITLSDGSQLEGLALNGNNFISKNEVAETTFAGNLYVNAKEATMYAGSAAGTSKGTFTATSLTVNTTITAKTLH